MRSIEITGARVIASGRPPMPLVTAIATKEVTMSIAEILERWRIVFEAADRALTAATTAGALTSAEAAERRLALVRERDLTLALRD
jgi:hypothetical protein